MIQKIKVSGQLFFMFYKRVLDLTGVPLTMVDTCSAMKPFASDTGASLEIPKSATLAVHLASNNILFALISR